MIKTKKFFNSFKTFKKLFYNLANDLVAKIPPNCKRFVLNTGHNYHQLILSLLPS